jgi:hypothetical protein
MASWLLVPLLGLPARGSALEEGDQRKYREKANAEGQGRARETFWTHHGAFRCTDIGTRVVVAVKLGPRARSHGLREWMESSGSRSGSTTTRAG